MVINGRLLADNKNINKGILIYKIKIVYDKLGCKKIQRVNDWLDVEKKINFVC